LGWCTRAVGIEEHTVKRPGKGGNDLGGIAMDEINDFALTCLTQVIVGKRQFVCLVVDTDDVTANRAGGPGQPDGTVSIRGPNFQQPYASAAAHQHAEQVGGCRLQVQHLPTVAWFLRIVVSPCLCEFGQQLAKTGFHKYSTPYFFACARR
jgi:hypothetical protein